MLTSLFNILHFFSVEKQSWESTTDQLSQICLDSLFFNHPLFTKLFSRYSTSRTSHCPLWASVCFSLIHYVSQQETLISHKIIFSRLHWENRGLSSWLSLLWAALKRRGGGGGRRRGGWWGMTQHWSLWTRFICGYEWSWFSGVPFKKSLLPFYLFKR